ncbi:multi-sensor signal transduction histidine kinase [Calothrix sp. NIES-4101]|nr:multi-sensor signal transduction histidine kinase [Calothrix sp. NIES-4101]
MSQPETYNQIHIPGSIQPHGVLLALSESLVILQVSDNVEHFLGKKPQVILNQHLDILFDAEQITAIPEIATTPNISTSLKLKLTQLTAESPVEYFDTIIHRSGTSIILELEPIHSNQEMSFLSFHSLVNDVIVQIQQTADIATFFDLVVKQVKKITSFDRVMVYKFDLDGSGSVIGEAKDDNLSPYLGLHYPATDIPETSKNLYTSCLLRFIPNFKVEFSHLIPSENPQTHQPLNLSNSILRSFDSCCLEFHENMGVASLLVISLIHEQKLWGLISCHNRTPTHLPYELRTACKFLGEIVSLELGNKLAQAELGYKNKLKSLQSQFIASISNSDNFMDALIHPAPRLLDVVSASGCAVCLGDDITLVGNTPTVPEIHKLIEWAGTHIGEDLWATNSLPKLFPDYAAQKDTASGLLLLPISRVLRYYILWFRPEVLQTVNWAGNPGDSIQRRDDGSLTLSPRHSFELWQEIVRLTAIPWQQCELDSASDLRNAIVGIVIHKADELAKINLELERSNHELDSFAYAASHDLKEPLRGIHNYSTILIEDYAHLLDAEGVGCLNTLVSLTQRMDALIDVLLRLSQLGQAELRSQPTDLNIVVDAVCEMFRASRKLESFDILIPRSLPTILCDTVLINEVFSNLIGNALKYNDHTKKWVEVGFFASPEEIPENLHNSPNHRQYGKFPVFYIRDNGIGIKSRHQEIIFRLFKRLHSQEKYGGGTGAGLAIAKKIIERHGGTIWVDSTDGKGSTFLFTLKY